MAIFFPPVPPVFIGGAQPYAQHGLPASIIAVEVDNPPFSLRTAAERAEIIALNQPPIWNYSFEGSQQPYAPRTLCPGIPGQSVDAPPFQHPSRSATSAELIAIGQPNPWTYNFIGDMGPYVPRPLSPLIEDVSVVDPPFSQRRAVLNAELIAANQPQIWTYNFDGATQPYAPRTLNPSTIAVEVDNPPFDQRSAQNRAESIALNQPPSWTYSFEGGLQPYAPTPLSVLFEGIPVPVPGSGKRYQRPTGYLPEPAYDAKPNKPFRPVWDKARGGEIETHPQATPAAPRPVPLPPSSIFGAPGQSARTTPLNLPDFNNLVPQDPLGLAKRMHDAQDASDAIALLKSLGLIREG